MPNLTPQENVDSCWKGFLQSVRCEGVINCEEFC